MEACSSWIPRASRGSDYVDVTNYEQVLNGCRFCLMCRHICTVGNATHQEGNTPRGRALNLFAARKGIIQEDQALSQLLYECCQCGLCQEWCASRYDHPGLVGSARRQFGRDGNVPPRVAEIRESVMRFQTPFQHRAATPHVRVAECLESLPSVAVPRLQGSPGRCGIYVGCVGREVLTGVGNSLARIGMAMGDERHTFGQEPCCGFPLYILGFEEEFAAQARMVVKLIEDAGITELLTLCPSCHRTFGKLYPEVGVRLSDSIRLMNANEYLVDALSTGRLSLEPSPWHVVTYHDSCQTARYLHDWDTPRRILALVPGVRFVEMQFSEVKARCCGAGSFMEIIAPAVAERAAADRMEEAAETGAELVLTDCPSCAHNLQRSSTGTQVLTLIEFVSSLLLSKEGDVDCQRGI